MQLYNALSREAPFQEYADIIDAAPTDEHVDLHHLLGLLNKAVSYTFITISQIW